MTAPDSLEDMAFTKTRYTAVEWHGLADLTYGPYDSLLADRCHTLESCTPEDYACAKQLRAWPPMRQHDLHATSPRHTDCIRVAISCYSCLNLGLGTIWFAIVTTVCNVQTRANPDSGSPLVIRKPTIRCSPFETVQKTNEMTRKDFELPPVPKYYQRRPCNCHHDPPSFSCSHTVGRVSSGTRSSPDRE
jgi:hypothetical protein